MQALRSIRRAFDNQIDKINQGSMADPARFERNTTNRAVSSGAVANLYDENVFSPYFDFVEYQEGYFKEYETLADEKVQKGTIREMKKIAAKSNPHMKAAMTDFQDYVVGGWGFKPHRTIVIDRFLDTMEDRFEGFDAYLSDMTDSIFLNSAWFHESVYDESLHLRRFMCLEHDTATFRRKKEGILGGKYALYQKKSNSTGSKQDIPLDEDPTAFYGKLYSRANYPYGVPFVDSAIFHMVMMVEFFKSYKSLLDSFILPNLFFRVDREIVEKVVTDPTERPAFVKSVFAQLMQQIKRLRPGRVITMGSEVLEPEILSGMNEKTIGASESLINALDNQLELALKTHGLTTLRNDSALNDTKAKYRMANYSRVIKRAQGVGTKRLNRQFNMAHIEAGYDPASTELYLERNIYEDEQILAEISSTISAARKAGFETLEKVLDIIDRAVEAGRMTAAQANQLFIDELARVENQTALADPLSSN